MNIVLSAPVRVALALVSGLLLPLCFPPVGWWPLVFVVFPALLLATMGTTPRRAFGLGLLHGVVGFGLSLYWLFNIFATAAIPLYFICALFTAAFCLAWNALMSRSRYDFANVALAATFWAAIEFYRSELFFLRFPWITPGVALGPTWVSPVLGVYGASFVVLAAAAGLMKRRTLPLGVGLSVLVLLLGIIRPGVVEPDEHDSIAVTVVQSEDCYLQSYLKLTRDRRDDNPDLIIWPEYALPYDVRKRQRDFDALKRLCAETDAVLVVGTKTVVGTGVMDWHNTALVMDESGVLGEYYKARPVHFFNDGIPGRKFEPTPTRLGAAGTPICFDCDYTEVTRSIVASGAEFLAVPSFDAISWSANQHLQHAVMFRLRAAENGRWLACAASSGVSQIIDPHGNVHASLPPMVTGAVTHRVSRRDGATLFNSVGWLFPWLALVFSVGLLLYASAGYVAMRVRQRRAGD